LERIQTTLDRELKALDELFELVNALLTKIQTQTYKLMVRDNDQTVSTTDLQGSTNNIRNVGTRIVTSQSIIIILSITIYSRSAIRVSFIRSSWSTVTIRMECRPPLWFWNQWFVHNVIFNYFFVASKNITKSSDSYKHTRIQSDYSPRY